MTFFKDRKRILLIVEMSRAHGRGIAEGIFLYASRYTDWIVNFESRSILEQKSDWLKSWSGDGIISRSGSKTLQKQLNRLGIPVIELFCDKPGDVESDGDLVGDMAARHLLSLGLQHFAFYAPASIWWLDWRLRGYVNTLGKHGFEPILFPGYKRKAKILLPFWEESFREELILWLRSLPCPIGIYSPTDILASRVLDACMTAEIRVPEEIAVLGTDDDTLVCNLTFPKLSSFGLNSCQIGFEAAALLDRKFNDPGFVPPSTILVPPLEVSPRLSTSRLAIPDADIAQAIHLLREHAHNGITVADIIEKSGVDSWTLQRQFKKWLGHSPIQEIILSRLKYAKKLLIETDESIDFIAKRSAFNSTCYFIAMFRQNEGVTPKQYRQQHQIVREKLIAAH